MSQLVLVSFLFEKDLEVATPGLEPWLEGFRVQDFNPTLCCSQITGPFYGPRNRLEGHGCCSTSQGLFNTLDLLFVKFNFLQSLHYVWLPYWNFLGKKIILSDEVFSQIPGPSWMLTCSLLFCLDHVFTKRNHWELKIQFCEDSGTALDMAWLVHLLCAWGIFRNSSITPLGKRRLFKIPL